MEAILNQIISATVAKFASALSEKTSLPTEEIIEMWKAAVGSVSVQVDGEKATKTRKRPVTKETAAEEAKPSSDEEKPAHMCPFKPKKGNNVCGKPVGAEGSMYAAHKRYEAVAKADVVAEKTCGAVISKGDRKGETCGAKVKEGSECCSKHTKKEKPVVEKKPESGDDEKKTCAAIVSKGDRKGQECGANVKEGIDNFWKINFGKDKPTQLQRYEKNNAPDGIKKFIAIGGGPKMGATLEKYAQYKFNNLKKRLKGKDETGYDHLIKLATNDNVFVEQKSAGHWGDNDYKWQHVEEKHKWNMLLLCGIDYFNVKFWGMDRKTFNSLISEKKITNQGNKTDKSSEGMWFNYSDVKDMLVEIQTDEQLLQFASSLQVSE